MYPPGTDMLTIGFFYIENSDEPATIDVELLARKMINAVGMIGDTECTLRSSMSGFVGSKHAAIGNHFCVLDTPAKRKMMLKAYKRALKFLEVAPDVCVQMEIKSLDKQLSMVLNRESKTIVNNVSFRDRMEQLENDAR